MGYRLRAAKLLATIPLLAVMGLFSLSPAVASVSSGSVTFHKTVDNSAGGSAVASDFTMTLTSTDGGQTYSGNHDGDTINVVSDTYTLTESSLPNYTSLYGGGCYNTATQAGSAEVVTVVEGDTWICGFTNTYVPPATASVTFHKTVDNSAGGSAAAGDFKMNLINNDPNGPSYSGFNGDVNNVVPGTYTLIEKSFPGYTSVYGGGCYNSDTQANTGDVVTFAAGENWVCGFTNTYVPSTVSFLKEVDNSAGGTAAPGDFKMTLTNNDPSGPSYSGFNGDEMPNVVPGTYTLTEASLPGYTSIYGGGCYNSDTQANTGDVVTIGYSENWVCGFTNTYIPSTVTFLKEVDNSAGGSALPGDFKLTLSGDQNYTGYSGDTFNVLPGTYTLTESSMANYTSIYGGGCYNTATQANSGAIVTIGYSENWVCGFTNTFVPTPTPTPTETASATPTATPTETASATPTETPSATPSETPSATPTETASATPTETPSATPSETPSATPSETASATPSETPSATPSETPSATPSETPSSTPSSTPSATPSATPTPTPCSCETPSATPTVTPSATPSVAPSATPHPSPSAMPDTTTGGPSGPDGALPLILIGLAFLFVAGSYSLWRARGFMRP